jgi:glycosyltransferase domain-containing protein
LKRHETLQDITGVLLSRNRHSLLSERFSIIRDYGFPVVILDGSDTRAHDIEAMAEDVPSLRYIHMPGLWLSERILASADAIETPYVVQLADDDICIRQGLLEAKSWLDSHHDYAAAQGSFWIRHKVDGDYIYDLEGAGPSLGEARAADRLTAHLSYFSHTAYALMRRDVYLKAAAVSQNFKDDGCFYELSQSLAAVALGKLKRFQTPFGLRSANTAADHETKYIHHPLLWKQKDPVAFEAALDRFVNVMTTHGMFDRLFVRPGFDLKTAMGRYMDYLETPGKQILETSKHLLHFLSGMFPGQDNIAAIERLKTGHRESELDILSTMEHGFETIFQYIHFFGHEEKGILSTPYSFFSDGGFSDS